MESLAVANGAMNNYCNLRKTKTPQVIVHHPMQWPNSANFIPAGTMTSIVVKPTYSYATARVARWTPVKRDCFNPVMYLFSNVFPFNYPQQI